MQKKAAKTNYNNERSQAANQELEGEGLPHPPCFVDLILKEYRTPQNFLIGGKIFAKTDDEL